MKTWSKYIIVLALSVIVSACKTTEKPMETLISDNSLLSNSNGNMTIAISNGKAHNHPTFVIWEEDNDGNYLRTVFITQSYARGIFGYKMIGDSIWMPEEGRSPQPAALPYWSHKKSSVHKGALMPSPEHPFVDAYTSATPVNNFQFETARLQHAANYRLLLEVNQSWDWNSHWTNNKYPSSEAYMHSAQPSLVYSVSINPTDTLYYLNPIGHGHPEGANGELYTNLNTLTTAREIFESIKVVIRQK